MATREDLHRLVDALPEDRLAWAAIDLAPYDDEPVSAEDRAAIAEGERSYADGSWREWPTGDQVADELGIRP